MKKFLRKVPPLFAGGKKWDSHPPGSHAARMSRGSRLWLLIAFILLSAASQSVFAENLYADKMVQFDSSHLQSGGYIDITIPVYDEDAEDEWPVDGYMEIDGKQCIQFSTKEQGVSNNHHLDIRRSDLKGGEKLNNVLAYAETYVTYTTYGQNNTWIELIETSKTCNYRDDGNDNTYATVRIYPSVSVLQKGSMSVLVKYTRDSTGPNSDAAQSKTATFSFSVPTPPAVSWGYSSNPGKQAISFNGTNGDSYSLYQGDTEGSSVPINQTGTVNVEVGISNANRTYNFKYYKKLSNHQTLGLNATSITVPALYYPTDFEAEQIDGGDVKLTWTVKDAPDGAEGGDTFEVQRSDDAKFTTSKAVGTLDYVGNGSYEIIDRTSRENINGHYYYRLRRTKVTQWQWSYTKNKDIDIEMRHRKVASAFAKIVDGNSVEITWDYDDGNVVTDGYTVMLMRTNEMKGITDTYAIPEKDMKEKVYREELLSTCDVYSYRIYVVPGTTVYRDQEPILVQSDGDLYTVEIGDIVSFSTSKGYFSDRVELEWETDGDLVDVFSIRAREYGSNGEFKQIDQVEGNVASTSYSYSDTKSIPGTIYEYQVVATTACGGGNMTSNSPIEIGFRTPTGDIYGRVTFESGQGVPEAEVRAEATDGSGVKGKSYEFAAGNALLIPSHLLLKDATAGVTLQAWVKTDSNDGNLIAKDRMYELLIEGGKPVFKAGSDNVEAGNLADYHEQGEYVHLSAVADSDSLFIYVNGKKVGKAKRTSATVDFNDNQLVIGGGSFVGNIDEVRVWNRALPADTLLRDYNRMLVGNEVGLVAYYTFDYSVDTNFYDISYKGSNYNANHGTVDGAVLSETIPTETQLGYRAITGEDGSYSIRALPYSGNGTSYMIIPRLGIHTFESTKELRLINANSQSHTVNFTDMSSFEVSGIVTYYGGTVPVEGVNFTVDGTTVMDGKGKIIYTDAKGEFTINVPVGTHEVKAVKANHVFVNEGKITNSDGSDRNYQDKISGIELQDSTTVRYVGRIAGGAVEEELPVGHSLSKNNLGDGIKLTLTYQNEAYKLNTSPRKETKTHFQPLWQEVANTNEVEFSENTVTVYPNLETGEFVVDLVPEKYRVTVTAPGHDGNTIIGSGEEINLQSAFSVDKSTYEWTDSITEKGQYIVRNDTVEFNRCQQFIKRYTPTIDIYQLSNSGQRLDYFGKDAVSVVTLLAEDKYEVKLWNEETQSYTFGRPVFDNGQSVKLGIDVFEEYRYKDADGNDKAGIASDKVPTVDAVLNFSASDLPYGTLENVEVDSIGHGTFDFKVQLPELTSGMRSLSAIMTYGDSENPTSVDWQGKFDAVVIGARMQGANFITKGPDKVLFVLRDPPGSNSYSYLEKGVRRTDTDTYTGSVINEGSEIVDNSASAKVITWTGVGAGITNENEVTNDTGLGVIHEETIGGSDSWTKTTETTTRFQTSADPEYVGANGDLYVGYSTNLGFGKTDNVQIISKEDYQKNPSDYSIYTDITPVGSDWLVVQSTGIGINSNVETLFAYPQVHIEEVLIPQMEEVRNGLLHQQAEGSDSQFQSLANQSGELVYVSKLAADDENYGKSNSDTEAFPNRDGVTTYDGPSYKIYIPENYSKNPTDTILTLNQGIEAWKERMKENEAEKVNAKLLQNYSYQAGASVEYSESYTYSESSTTNFELTIGAQFSTAVGVKINGLGMVLKIEENTKTTQGGEFTTEEEATHCNGFVLEDTGSDYISVDVCRQAGYADGDNYLSYDDIMEEQERGTQYPTLIFKTKGGQTSCPYESGYKTKYYSPGTEIDVPTVQIEVPEISVENNFIQNVPSGKAAYFTLYLRNNSESKDDNWYDLKIIDGSNPDGAQLIMDGAAIGNGRALLVPAGETLVKTLEVRKGRVMNYDNLQLALQSQCQCDPTDFLPEIADTVAISVHFTPSATSVRIKTPGNNWTYNTKLPTTNVDGIDKHYLTVQMDEFDVNYDNFYRIMLQYKPKSGGDSDWTTLMSYYNDEELYNAAIANQQNAELIDPDDAGTITYNWFLDDMPDQYYDLRAVGTSMINNVEVFNYSDVYSGIKDMYNPRLFGSAQPADGVLSVGDEVMLTFNETIAEGYLTKNGNFEVTGIRNGAQTDHSVSVQLDGNDALTAEFNRNWAEKDLTIEMWIQPDMTQNAVLFSHGNINNSLELAMTADNHLKVKVGNDEVVSSEAVNYEAGNWAHVALTLDKSGKVSAYYNFVAVINNATVAPYTGEGTYAFGASVNGGGNFTGKMHGARIWNKIRTSGQIQTESLVTLSGVEANLLALYPMDEGKGSTLLDKARGVNLAADGTEWALPEGRAASFNGSDQYLRLNTGSSVVVDSSMDYTIEFWFKGDESNNQNARTMIANGRGDGNDMGGSLSLFDIGFENGVLAFTNNGVRNTTEGNFLDGNWHHFALSVSRTTGRGQIYIDGKLNTFFNSENIGGISAAYMYVGARGWTPKDNASIVNVDNFFNGSIDDLRIWNLYKSESLVEEGSNVHLDGTEKGLLAYYPFEYYREWQGVNELNFTLADQKKADEGEAVPDADQFGAASVETSASSPVKSKGAVSSLDFDFVVNDDALIINLLESLDRIEKTIVTFTVDGVRDMNGNELLSPITWSAYIDRNQLRWSDSEVVIEKDYLDETTFTVKAVNNGGSIQNYTIENLPAWLEADPSSGTLDPLASADIKFTIDGGLNIGSYDEVIYLRGTDGVVEGLPLSVKVIGEKPDWTVNPADFKYSMTVTGLLRFNNIYSSDEEDMLAAFQNGKCIGVATGTYNKVHDMYYTFLTVYNNEMQADNIEFRSWDASTGKIYSATPSEVIVFNNGANYGSSASPVIFDGKEMMYSNIALNEGWTWISFNLANSLLSDVTSTLANGEWADGDVVKSNYTDNLASYSARDKRWKGTMTGSTAFNNTSMFMLRSSVAQTLGVNGTAIDARTMPITLEGGTWNYIGYLPTVTYTVKEALAGYEATEGDIIKSQSQFATYSGRDWVGSLTYMQPNHGYMLRKVSNGSVTFTYPTTTGSLASQQRLRSSMFAPAYENTDYADNMTIVAKAVGAEPGDRVLAYVGDELRGVANIVDYDGNELQFLNIAGSDAAGIVTFRLERDGEEVAEASTRAAYETNSSTGSPEEPMLIEFGPSVSQAEVYPSPFTTVLHIDVNVVETSDVVVEIYDISGKLVWRSQETAAAGWYRLDWNGESAMGGTCADGTYLVHIATNGEKFVKKVIKK